MTPLIEEVLRVEAHRAKKYFESGNAGSLFKRFPHGCCTPASKYLADYLAESYDVQPWLVTDSHDPQRGHAWLEIDGVIIDITAHQFPDFKSDFFDPQDGWHARRWMHQHRHPRPPEGFVRAKDQEPIVTAFRTAMTQKQ